MTTTFCPCGCAIGRPMWGEKSILQISLCPEHAEALSDLTEKIVKQIVDSNDYELDNKKDREET